MGFDTADFLIGTIDEMPGKQYSVWRMNFYGSRRGKMAEIVFDHVTFGYEKEKPVLKDLVRERLFSRYIFLKNGELPGQVEVIVNEEGKRLC